MKCRSKHFYALAAATVAMFTAYAAKAEPTNLSDGVGGGLTFLHMYSAEDGTTHIVERTLPPAYNLERDPQKLVATYFSGTAHNVNLLTYKNGFNSPWRYARPKDSENGHAVILLHGQLDIMLDEQRTVRVKQGTLMFNDDSHGQGHRTKCVNEDELDNCLILQMDIKDSASIFIGKVEQ